MHGSLDRVSIRTFLMLLPASFGTYAYRTQKKMCTDRPCTPGILDRITPEVHCHDRPAVGMGAMLPHAATPIGLGFVF